MAQSYGIVQKGGSVSQTLKDAGFGSDVYMNRDAWEKVRIANNLDSRYTVYANQRLDFSSLLGTQTQAQPAAAPEAQPQVQGATQSASTDQSLLDFQNEYKAQADKLDSLIISSEDVEAQVNQAMSEIDIPKPPKLTELFDQLVESSGVNETNERLARLKQERATIEDRLRSRLAYAENGQVSMNVIAGRTNEIQRQEQSNLQYINSAIQITVEEQQAAMNIIQLKVGLEGEDYQNALQWYTTTFNTKMKAIEMINSAKQTEWSQEMELRKWQQSTASAQLAIYTEMIEKGTLNPNALTKEQLLEIGKLEVQAGLPIGFLKSIQIDPSKKIQSITQRQGNDGYMYSDIVRVDPYTGQVSVENVKLGRFYVAPRASGGGSGRSSTTLNKYGYTGSQWSSLQKEARDMLSNIEDANQRYVYRDNDNEGKKKGDKMMADWEIDEALAKFKNKYGKAGEALFNDAFDTGGYRLWNEWGK